jgi:hypothetical protein
MYAYTENNPVVDSKTQKAGAPSSQRTGISCSAGSSGFIGISPVNNLYIKRTIVDYLTCMCLLGFGLEDIFPGIRLLFWSFSEHDEFH